MAMQVVCAEQSLYIFFFIFKTDDEQFMIKTFDGTKDLLDVRPHRKIHLLLNSLKLVHLDYWIGSFSPVFCMKNDDIFPTLTLYLPDMFDNRVDLAIFYKHLFSTVHVLTLDKDELQPPFALALQVTEQFRETFINFHKDNHYFLKMRHIIANQLRLCLDDQFSFCFLIYFQEGFPISIIVAHSKQFYLFVCVQ